MEPMEPMDPNPTRRVGGRLMRDSEDDEVSVLARVLDVGFDGLMDLGKKQDMGGVHQHPLWAVGTLRTE